MATVTGKKVVINQPKYGDESVYNFSIHIMNLQVYQKTLISFKIKIYVPHRLAIE